VHGATRRRAADAPELLVPLDSERDQPLHRQVYDGVRDAILLGRLAPGARLPSTRTLAGDLGVARNTVTLAFDQLRAEGYLIGRRGGGTRVRNLVPDALLRVDHPLVKRGRSTSSRPSTPVTTRHPTARHADEPVRLSLRGARLVAEGALSARRSGTKPVTFRLGVPALEEFPAQLWGRLSARRWRRGEVALGDGDSGGESALRAAIAEYIATARGARCVADQVILVSGTHQALDLAARVLLDHGDEVWMEDPGYSGARVTLEAAGATIVAVPVDDEGIDVIAGERTAPRAKLAYVTPSHQFPLGAVMSASRRLALLSWARRVGAWIVEDDYDSEFRYAGRPLACLQGLDVEQRRDSEGARVLYVGTFSKTLVPGLRVAYLVVPEQLVDAFRSARAATDRHPPTVTQGVLTDFIRDGHYARHVRRVRALYAERQATLVEAGERLLRGALALPSHSAGLHLVGWLPPRVSDAGVVAAAETEGVELFALSHYSIARRPPGARGALLFGYAGFTDREIRRGIERLARVLDHRAAR
jgi:GntR family transcriptional regulator/MocR family aminotransferase